MNLRFGHFFAVMMLIALLCSVALPTVASRRITSSFQSLFSPISGPIHWLAGSIRPASNYADDKPLLPINDTQERLQKENRALKDELERLSTVLEKVRAQIASNDFLGSDLAPFAVTLRVIGLDAGGRQILKLSGTEHPLKGDQIVVYNAGGATGLVGKTLDGVGAGNQANVRLLTDKGFTFVVTFGELVVGPDGHPVLNRVNEKEPTLVEGMGGGEMRVRDMMKEQADRFKLHVGMQAFLEGPDEWPMFARGRRVGVITAIAANRTEPLFVEIRIKPEIDLTTLREVTVIAK